MTSFPMTWEEAVQWYVQHPEKADEARAAYLDDPVSAAKRYHASQEFAALKTYLPSTPGRALDLGAGNGILSYALAREGWDVTSVEPDASDFVGAGAIEKMAAATDLPLTIVKAFGEDLPLKSANFDIVVARQVLHHAHDLDGFCREMSRLSAQGAKIITLRDHVITGPDQMQAFLDSHALHYLYGGENAYTLAAYRSALKSAGLNIMQELNSFESVINYDPAKPNDIIQEVAKRFGPLRLFAQFGLKCLPFSVVCKILTRLDNRPGRHVSFVCEKPHHG